MRRVLLLALVCCSFAFAGRHPGLEHLATKAYSPTIMDPAIFDNLWRSWDGPSREAAEKASGSARRRMTLERYGLLEAPYDNGGAPLGMVVQPDGSYALTCFVCHAGAVEGRTHLGLPNASLDFSAIFEDVEKTVTILHGNRPGNPPFPQGLLFMANGKPAPHIEFPEGLLGVSRGTTNSFTFSVQFFSQRDKELNVVDTPLDLKPLNHYLDPPPLWHVARKTTFYTDGFAPKTVRPLMQFSLDPSIAGAQFRAWEADYKDIYEWLHTLESPKYAGRIDRDLVAGGQQVYAKTCARCHGSPGPGGSYPNKIVAIDTVNTDRARLDGLSTDFKTHLRNSWLGEYGATDISTRAKGYVAPPLDGIWASAPYFHNGSVPTLYHVLFPEERPQVWKVKDYRAYDHGRVGLLVEELARMPETSTLSEKRSYYDTTRDTMSSGGHLFADRLSREQRLSLLEYLKSL
jgi:hypothetical protein